MTKSDTSLRFTPFFILKTEEGGRAGHPFGFILIQLLLCLMVFLPGGMTPTRPTPTRPTPTRPTPTRPKLTLRQLLESHGHRKAHATEINANASLLPEVSYNTARISSGDCSASLMDGVTVRDIALALETSHGHAFSS